MDLSPGQRNAVFALIVVVLAVLGYFLVVPALTHSHSPARAATSPSATPPAETSAPPAVVPAVTASAAAAGGVNIYSWLPFTQQNLATASSVAVQFSIDYNTFTYTETAADYVAKMGGLITGQLASTLQTVYQTPGVAKLRTTQKQVSTGTAAITSIRAFGPSSLTFIVNAGQRLATTNGITSGSTQYAVTVTGAGSSWQVSDIELQDLGNS
ncbi:MAG: hypothetical protein ACRDOB_21935 [Streptosporangiaceae bacterium]